MQCNYNSFTQIINFHGLFRNALRCRKTGVYRILVPLRYRACMLRVLYLSLIIFKTAANAAENSSRMEQDAEMISQRD